MGVSGSGKSTVGEALAARLAVPYADGDDFHPAANRAKMAAGTPLTDEDRWPWLESVGEWMEAQVSTGSVVACSALRVAYRDVLRRHVASAYFVNLYGDVSVVRARFAERKGHFMPEKLIESQYATLEHLGPDERGITVDFALPVTEIVEVVVADLERSR
ncbi:adenylyl-sulfate kinase [Epidermidibacterium keratini]|uniref:Gluconokinase n=2 Tax=Epidermidibacterium keratini TaxID=1891644 RepID=A0A7L4YT64_9ACTN|nr:adenylyl-sulfate kinase [Epidermidibacterium keratini]